MLELKQANDKLVEEQNIRQSVLDDPAIKQVIDLRKAGNEVQVEKLSATPPVSVRDKIAAQSSAVVDNGDAKLNGLTNAELVNVLLPALESQIAEIANSTRDEATGSLEKRFQRLESNQGILHKTLVNQFATLNMQKMEESYADFPEFREEALKVHKENPNLPLEKCYFLAKAEAGSTIPARNVLDTERPGSASTRSFPIGRNPDRRSDFSRNEGRTVSSQQAFRDLVNKGVENVVSRRRR